MKITKLPFETKIKCDCGCEFEFEYKDIDIESFAEYALNRKTPWQIIQLSINCPLCNKTHIIKEEVN